MLVTVLFEVTEEALILGLINKYWNNSSATCLVAAKDFSQIIAPDSRLIERQFDITAINRALHNFFLQLMILCLSGWQMIK